MSSWHSMHDVMVGKTTRDCPLNPTFCQPRPPYNAYGPHAFGSSINQRLQTLRILIIDQIYQSRVDPSPSFNTVQTTNNNIELHIKLFVLILDLAVVWCDLDSFDSFLDKSGCNFGFRLSNVCLAEEELAVEVANIDCVHIYDMNVLEAAQTEILQYLASKTASPDHSVRLISMFSFRWCAVYPQDFHIVESSQSILTDINIFGRKGARVSSNLVKICPEACCELRRCICLRGWFTILQRGGKTGRP